MSKGMQQRLGIAQALVGAPPLLLLDEPTSALDPVGRRTVRLLLEELRGRGISVLLNSHLLSEIELVCDRVVILAARRGGRRGRAGRARPRPAASRSRPTRARERLRGRDARGRARPRCASSSLPAGRSTASASSLRRSRSPTSRRSEARRRERDPDDRRLRPARGAAAAGCSRVVLAADRRLPLPLLARQPLRSSDDIERDRRAGSGSTRAHLPGLRCFGLAMFATLFLGVVLAVFLTLGAVRGDAERGLLQPLVVRPVGRSIAALRALARRGRPSARRTSSRCTSARC